MQSTTQIIKAAIKEEIDQSPRINSMDSKLNSLETKMNSVDNKLDKIQSTLDWLVGEYKKFDEEHSSLAYQVSSHSDRLENLEVKVFGSTQA